MPLYTAVITGSIKRVENNKGGQTPPLPESQFEHYFQDDTVYLIVPSLLHFYEFCATSVNNPHITQTMLFATLLSIAKSMVCALISVLLTFRSPLLSFNSFLFIPLRLQFLPRRAIRLFYKDK
jgi:hypothetical protein